MLLNIILLYYILYYYYIILLYIILYSSLPLHPSSVPFPSIFLLFFSSSLLFSPLLFFYHPFLYTLLSSSIPSLSSFPIPIFLPPHSKYTCRCLLLDTYIPSMFMFCSIYPPPSLSNLSFTGILTPHVLSEWMVEVCRFYMYVVLA